MFLKVVDCTSEYQDKHYIANIIMHRINEVGAQNIVQIIPNINPNI